jgi:hypothetical protein
MAMNKLGIIGLSEGNGHPYSWSAIINGYDHSKLLNCGYPSIPKYLSMQKIPSIEFNDYIVNSVYSDDIYDSKKISEACLIPHISKSLSELHDNVDRVLLARDDAENHSIYAEEFLKSGMRIFIDKPIAIKLNDLDKLYKMSVQNDQIFSCSALRYAKELYPSKVELKKIGDLIYVNGVTPKAWEKYAVHLIDPIIHFMNFETIKSQSVEKNSLGQTFLTVKWSNGISSEIISLGEYPSDIFIEYIGTKGSIKKTFSDSYSAFSKSLLVFLSDRSIGHLETEFIRSQRIVALIEKGL